MSIDIPTRELEFRTPLAADNFNLQRRSGAYDILFTQGEYQDPEIIQKSWRIHARSYVDFEYFSSDALLDDETLDPALDGTREKDDTAFHATYLLAVPRGKGVKDAQGTVRVLDPIDGLVENLPTYKYCRDEGSADTLARLLMAVAKYKRSPVREIAALGYTGNPLASYENMRALIQNATAHEAETGQEEVFIAALTDKSLGPVIDIVGDGAYEILGEPTEIFQDDPRAARGLSVTPILMLPSRILEATMERALREDEKKKATLDRRLLFFADGLEVGQMPLSVTEYIKSL